MDPGGGHDSLVGRGCRRSEKVNFYEKNGGGEGGTTPFYREDPESVVTANETKGVYGLGLVRNRRRKESRQASSVGTPYPITERDLFLLRTNDER